MTNEELFAVARRIEGTDTSDDIPAVVALTPSELAVFAQQIRLQAIEDAALMLESESDEAQEWGYERFARYTAEAARKVRALSQKK